MFLVGNSCLISPFLGLTPGFTPGWCSAAPAALQHSQHLNPSRRFLLIPIPVTLSDAGIKGAAAKALLGGPEP